MKLQKMKDQTAKKYFFSQVYLKRSKKNMFCNRNRLFPKLTERLMRIMENNSLVLGKQPAETPAREDEK